MEGNILKFLDGSLFNEIYPLPHTKEYGEMLKKIISKNEDMYNSLCDFDKGLADKYKALADEYRELSAYEQQESFKSGFCMGARLTAEVYSDRCHGTDQNND